MTTSRTLQRSSEDRLISGIAGGLAERFDLDPVAVRMGWLVACVLTAGGAAVLYAGLSLLIPLSPPTRSTVVRSDPKQPVKRVNEIDLRDEARILLEVRRELGPEYEDE
jgi:phage shock protein C